MQILLTIIHVIVCLILVMVVLLQAGKGASMGAAFGGASSTIFGSTGPETFLGKMTTAVAVVFMLTSLSLCYLGGQGGKSLVSGATRAPIGKTAPMSKPVIPPDAQGKNQPGSPMQKSQNTGTQKAPMAPMQNPVPAGSK